MGIIIKFIIKSIKEKKFRTFLIIFAVALSGALYFASTSLSDSLVDIYTNKMKQSTGRTDIMIYPTRHSPAGGVSVTPLQRFKDKTKFVIKAVNGTARYKVKNKDYERISLTGMTLKDYESINDLQLASSVKGASFDSGGIIISQKTADRYKLKLGDRMELHIAETRRQVKIYGIALPAGMFLDESQDTRALISYKTLCDYMNTEGKPTIVYVKAQEEADIQSLIKELGESYPKYEVREPFSTEELYDSISMIAMPLLLMTFIVTFMSMFIIYSSFKVITLEKLPIIGTFRSIGASKKMMNKVLFLESLFYGVVGGIAACIIGIGILYLLTDFSTAAELKKYITIRIDISPIKLIMTFVLSLGVCFVSSMAPIFKVSKIPLKEVVLGNIETKRKRKVRKDVLGVVYIILAFIFPLVNIKGLSLILSGLSVILILLGVINILPTVIKYTSKPSEKIFCKLFGNIGSLAVKNIRGNKSILNSISLITIGIATLLMINNISMNLSTEIIYFYEKTFKSDLHVWMNGMDKSSARGIVRQEGVEAVYPTYEVYGIEAKEMGEKISYIQSVKDESHDRYYHYDYQGDKKKMLNTLDEDRYIITTVILKNRYKLKEGDKLTLKFPNGERSYTILGFINTLMNNGSFALIDENYLKSDSKLEYYTVAAVKVKDNSDLVLEKLKKQYSERYFGGRTVEEMLKNNKESNDQLMSMLIGFSGLALIIGIVGIINNLIISFIERKKGLAVLRSVGMSQKQIIRLLFIEAFYSGIIGGIAGISAGVIITQIMPYVLEAMKVPLPVYLVPGVLWMYLAGGIIIIVLAAVTPARSASKLNIIEAIKYE